jgi:hypothetical protein
MPRTSAFITIRRGVGQLSDWCVVSPSNRTFAPSRFHDSASASAGSGATHRKLSAALFQLQVVGHGGGVTLILVAAGDLVSALGDQFRHGVAAAPGAPVGNLRSEGGGQAEIDVGGSQPGKPAVAGEAAAEEFDVERERTARKAKRGYGGHMTCGAHPGGGTRVRRLPFPRGVPRCHNLDNPV